MGLGRGGAGAPTMADRKVCRGSSGLVLAKVAAADSWEPSNVGRSDGEVGVAVDAAGIGAGTEPSEGTSKDRSVLVDSAVGGVGAGDNVAVLCNSLVSISSSILSIPPSSSSSLPPNSCSLVVRTAATVCAKASATCLRLDLNWSTLEPASLGL